MEGVAGILQYRRGLVVHCNNNARTYSIICIVTFYSHLADLVYGGGEADSVFKLLHHLQQTRTLVMCVVRRVATCLVTCVVKIVSL